MTRSYHVIRIGVCLSVLVYPSIAFSQAVVFSEDFESASFANWTFTDSTNSVQNGSLCPGTWAASIATNSLEGTYSARLYAQSTSSCSPWLVASGIRTTVAPTSQLSAKLKFDAIASGGGVGISYFEIAAINALNTAESVRYRFSTAADVGGDLHTIVNPGDQLDFIADFGSDFFNKYGLALPGDVIIYFRSVSDYAEGGTGTRTTDVRFDAITVTLTQNNRMLADFDGNCQVDVGDALLLVLFWLSSDFLTDIVPAGGDGIVNHLDFSGMAELWGMNNSPLPQPCLGDMDCDGLLDTEELLWFTDPLNPDTDGDGLLDGWEAHPEGDPNNNDPNSRIALISQNVTLALCDSLIVDQAEFRFAPGVELRVAGTLQITNSTLTAESTNWQGIICEATAQGTLDNCVIEWANSAVELHSDRILVESCQIINCVKGIDFYANSRLHGTFIECDTIDIAVQFGAAPIITNTLFSPERIFADPADDSDSDTLPDWKEILVYQTNPNSPMALVAEDVGLGVKVVVDYPPGSLVGPPIILPAPPPPTPLSFATTPYFTVMADPGFLNIHVQAIYDDSGGPPSGIYFYDEGEDIWKPNPNTGVDIPGGLVWSQSDNGGQTQGGGPGRGGPGDSDGDGLSDDEEAYYGTEPNNVDTDGDGLTDKYEVDNAAAFGITPTAPSILVEIDSYHNTGGILQSAVDEFVNGYIEHGYEIYVEIDETNLNSNGNFYDHVYLSKQGNGQPANTTHAKTIKDAHLASDRWFKFRYIIVAPHIRKYSGDNGGDCDWLAALALQINDDDLYMLFDDETINNLPNRPVDLNGCDSDFPASWQNYTLSQWQASTMMHELGHTLGAKHRDGEDGRGRDGGIMDTTTWHNYHSMDAGTLWKSADVLNPGNNKIDAKAAKSLQYPSRGYAIWLEEVSGSQMDIKARRTGDLIFANKGNFSMDGTPRTANAISLTDPSNALYPYGISGSMIREYGNTEFDVCVGENAAGDEQLFVVWNEYDSGTDSHRVLFSRSKATSTNLHFFDTPVEIIPTTNDNWRFGLSMACRGPNIFLVVTELDWTIDPLNLVRRTKFYKSTDAGANWSAPIQLDSYSIQFTALTSHLTISDDPNMDVYIAWTHDLDVKFAKSSNAGTSFASPVTAVRFSTTTNGAEHLDMVLRKEPSGSTTILINFSYLNMTGAWRHSIKSTRSYDDGATWPGWQSPIEVHWVSSPSYFRRVQTIVDGAGDFVTTWVQVWWSSGYAPGAIYMKKSIDGIIWGLPNQYQSVQIGTAAQDYLAVHIDTDDIGNLLMTTLRNDTTDEVDIKFSRNGYRSMAQSFIARFADQNMQPGPQLCGYENEGCRP